MNDWYGFEKGGDRKSKEKIFPLKTINEPTTQLDLATTYGITKQTMNNYMRLAKAIPELEDLVDTGIVMAHTKREYQNVTPFCSQPESIVVSGKIFHSPDSVFQW